jgi:peptidylprolyl isomerase
MTIPARDGDTVKVHYTGTLKDGTVFDSSRGRDPLEFTIGAGRLIPAFEQTVIGMSLGESRTTTIPAENAYGTHREELVLVVDRDRFPPDMEPGVGQQLELRRPDGCVQSVTITETSDSSVTLDANHPLAGQDLTFDIELVEVI